MPPQRRRQEGPLAAQCITVNRLAIDHRVAWLVVRTPPATTALYETGTTHMQDQHAAA
jgi:hypothetical protein